MHTTPIKKISKRGSVAFLIFSNLFFLVIPVLLISVAVTHLLNCPAKPHIPFAMLYVAALLIIDRLIFWKRLINETRFEKTFPRPDMYRSAERLKTWERNRLSSSSRWLHWAANIIRTQLFIIILFGAMDTNEARQLDEHDCAHVLVMTGFLFCLFAILIFAFAIVGTMYIYFAELLTKMDQTATAALNRLM